MIIVADERVPAANSYAASFRQEGVPASGLSPADLRRWIASTPKSSIDTIGGILIGECTETHQIAAAIRERSATALIALREDRSLASTLDLFNQGFDDVVPATCHVREIMARMQAIVRRARSDPGGERDIRTFRDGRDPLVSGAPMKLPRRELHILECLDGAGDRALTKGQIFSAVYGAAHPEIDENVVESHICRLRRRLRERLGYDPIESRRHLGYRLSARPAQTSL